LETLLERSGFARRPIKAMSFVSVMSEAISGTSFASSPLWPLGIPPAQGSSRERTASTMTKSLDVITEIVRNPKHTFRKADAHAEKANRHRYERRKIKEFMKLGQWMPEDSAA
jgi:hypothetical protein